MKKFDFIVVGSGPGGIASAYELSKRFKVLIVEKGKIPTKNDYITKNSFQNLYEKVTPIFNKVSPFPFGQGSCFGGGSVINGALFWPNPKHTSKIWLSHFGKEFINDIDEYYLKWAKRLRVTHSSSSFIDNNLDSKLMYDAANKLDWNVSNVPRLLNSCVLNNNCGFGCDGKNSLDKFYELNILDKVERLVNTEVIAINHINGMASSIVTDKGEFFFKKGIIISAGAINSYSLLKRSRVLKKSYPQFHLNFKIIAINENNINAHKGTMFTHQIQEFIDKGILMMPTNTNINSILSTTINMTPKERKIILDNKDKVSIYVVQIQPSTIGSIKTIFGKQIISYNLNKSDYNKILLGIKYCIEWMKIAGFKKIVIPHKSNSYLRDINNCSINPKKLEFISVHGTSANRISTSPTTGNTNVDGKVFSTKNIWITDSSCLPSNTGESPQGVIMANASRIINGIS